MPGATFKVFHFNGQVWELKATVFAGDAEAACDMVMYRLNLPANTLKAEVA